jgi:hypothetical protein
MIAPTPITEPISIEHESGTYAQPLIIDGDFVTIDGGGSRIPITISHCSHFVLGNFNVHNSSEHCVLVQHCDHFVLDGICAWDAHPVANSCVFQFYKSHHGRVQDCAAWGSARKSFSSSYGGNDILFERCWARWERTERPDVRMNYAIAYNNHRNIYRDCIGQVLVNPGNFAGIFAADRIDDGTGPADTLVERCLAMSPWNACGFHPGKPGACEHIMFADCINATARYVSQIDRTALRRLLKTWNDSPLLPRLHALAAADPIADMLGLLFDPIPSHIVTPEKAP